MSPLKVMSTLAVEVALKRFLLPDWIATHGEVAMVWSPTAVLTQRIEAGERADLLIMIDGAMAALASSGIIAGDSIRPIARAGFGIGVRGGAPHPDISTREHLREALLNARAVAYSRMGASGRHFTHVIETLGIADEINRRAVVIHEGFTGTRLVSGEADLAVQQISELMSVDGVEVVGPFPGALQAETDFSAGVFAGSQSPDAARAFLAHLVTPAAGAAYDKGGLASRLDHPVAA